MTAVVEAGSWKLEAGSWKLGAGSWKLEAWRWKLDDDDPVRRRRDEKVLRTRGAMSESSLSSSSVTRGVTQLP
jgi:hypothetical protein